LEYAWQPHAEYLGRYGEGQRRVLMMGMNPGPWGMVQTGVPFGEVASVRDWMGIVAPVKTPRCEHSKRPVTGFNCTRSEVSGQRLWGWAASRFGTAAEFFGDFMVVNYCPMAFLAASGKNITPDKLKAHERKPLEQACLDSLRAQIEYYQPEWIIGIGVYAEKAAKVAVATLGVSTRVGRILHPSPASPAANRGWAGRVDEQLAALGVC